MLENDVKDKQGNYEGVYTFQGILNGMDYWVDVYEENAILLNNGWNIGYLNTKYSISNEIYQEDIHSDGV